MVSAGPVAIVIVIKNGVLNGSGFLMALKAEVISLTGWIHSGKQQNIIGCTAREIMAMGAVSLRISRARVIDAVRGVAVGGISVGSSRAGVTIRAVKGADCTVT